MLGVPGGCSGQGRLAWGAWAGVGLVIVRVRRLGYGGVPAAARPVRVLRRLRRVRGGSPAAARRALSCWRASQVIRMRWLRSPAEAAPGS